MDNSWKNRTLALAGIALAVEQVDELARTGYLNTQTFETAVHSLLAQNPRDVESVYGGIHNLRKGLEVLQKLLANPRSGERSNQMLGYCLGVFHLQKKLSKKPAMLSQIGERLTKAQHQVEHFGATHDNVIANLADIYSETISTFQFRIQVMGEYQYLQQTRVANQVRVLLFAAIRSAILWRQLGGSRWHLLLQRSAMTKANEALLEQIKRSLH